MFRYYYNGFVTLSEGMVTMIKHPKAKAGDCGRKESLLFKVYVLLTL